MGSKKDIGKAYKEQLEGYSSSPHNRVWENIEAELKKSKRRVFPIWKILTGLGILLLVSSIGVYSYYLNTNATENNIEIEQTHNDTLNKNSKNKTNEVIINSNEDNDNNTSVTDMHSESLNNSDSNTDSNTTDALNSTKSSYNKNATQVNNKNQVAKSIVTSQYKKRNTSKNRFTSKHNVNSNSQTESSLNNRLSNAITAISTSNDSIALEMYPVVYFEIDGLTKLEAEKKKKKKKKKKQEESDHPLTLTAYVTPTYTNVFGNGSSIDALLDNNKVSGGFHVNYGISATVKISKKSSLRLGIGASQLSYTIKGADTTSTSFFNEETQTEQLGGYLINASGYDNLTVNSQALNSTPELFGEGAIIDFKQKFKYLEVPIDYIYHLRDDSKLNINLIGGFSTLFLSDQGVIAKDRDGNSIEIGKAENLKKTNFSFNLGGNLSYSLSKKLSLELEPTFKYYLSTFNNNVDSKPYNFGLRFGISYRF